VKFNYTVVGTFIPKCTALGIHCWSKKKKKKNWLQGYLKSVWQTVIFAVAHQIIISKQHKNVLRH